MDQNEYYKKLIYKKYKSEKEWNLLRQFCQKHNQIDLFNDLYSKKDDVNNNFVKTSSFFSNLGVSTFSELERKSNDYISTLNVSHKISEQNCRKAILKYCRFFGSPPNLKQYSGVKTFKEVEEIVLDAIKNNKKI